MDFKPHLILCKTKTLTKMNCLNLCRYRKNNPFEIEVFSFSDAIIYIRHKNNVTFVYLFEYFYRNNFDMLSIIGVSYEEDGPVGGKFDTRFPFLRRLSYFKCDTLDSVMILGNTSGMEVSDVFISDANRAH